ncbi:small ribosomal subunit Rsm22 family protein [Methanocella arvoryzae]|nr:small ribosomal subunit Rsm22 family protein [Methanocella arvoryzae]
MSDREIVSALKYVSRMKPSFMLSELRDYTKDEVSTADVYRIVEPLLDETGLRAVPEGEDYRIERLPKPAPLALGKEELERVQTFFKAPRVPRKLERLIENYVERKTHRQYDDPAVLEKLRQAVQAQKTQYWKEGKARKIDYSSGYSVLGYLAYQFPVYFVQFQHVLHDLATDGLLKDRIKVLDIGTGPGTVPLAIVDYYNRLDRAEATVYSLEKYDENIEAYLTLVPEYAGQKGRVRIEKPVKADLMEKPPVPDGIDLMVFSNVLNEIDAPFDAKVDAVVELASHLAPDGNIVIIEPADKENSTRMRRLVRRLLDKGLGIYSPCAFIWCDKCKADMCWSFEEKDDIQPTGLMKKLADTEESYKYLNTDIKFSYAILRKDTLTREKYRVPRRASYMRLAMLKKHVEKRLNVVAAVMSGDLGDKKDHVFKICDGTPAGPTYAMLAQYNVKPDNEALLKAKYGDVLEFENVLVRYNKENDSINLLVSKGSIVSPAGAEENEE